MKAFIFALAAPMMYAVANVLLEYRFAKLNNLTILIGISGVVLLMAIAVRSMTRVSGDISYDFPSGDGLLLFLVLGIIMFAADYLFVGAYTNGGSLGTITILMSLFPVFCALFKYAGSRFIEGMEYAPPNVWLVAGYLLAFFSVVCVVWGTFYFEAD